MNFKSAVSILALLLMAGSTFMGCKKIKEVEPYDCDLIPFGSWNIDALPNPLSYFSSGVTISVGARTITWTGVQQSSFGSVQPMLHFEFKVLPTTNNIYNNPALYKVQDSAGTADAVKITFTENSGGKVYSYGVTTGNQPCKAYFLDNILYIDLEEAFITDTAGVEQVFSCHLHDKRN